MFQDQIAWMVGVALSQRPELNRLRAEACRDARDLEALTIQATPLGSMSRALETRSATDIALATRYLAEYRELKHAVDSICENAQE